MHRQTVKEVPCCVPFPTPRNFRLRAYSIVPFLLFALISCTSGSTAPDAKRPAAAVDTAALNALLKKANGFSQVNFDSMRHYATIAAGMAESAGYAPGIARAKAVEANYQRRKGNYAASIQLSLGVIGQYDSLGMREEAVRMMNVLADTYKELGDEKQTGDYLEKGLELARQAEKDAEKMGYTEGVVMSLNEQGIILRDLSNEPGRETLMDSALALYVKAMDLVKKTGKGEADLGKLYNNTSQVYNEYRKNYPVALQYLNKAVAFNQARSNLNSLSYNYGNISDVYLRMGDKAQAGLYARKMLEIAQQLNAPHRLVNACNQVARVHKESGRYDSALFYREWSVSIADSLNNLQKTAQIADMQTKYETGKKDIRIGELSELNRVKNQRFWLLAGAAIVLSAFLGIVWYQKRRSQRQQRLIREQSDRLQWMMKELHHRVKNNLQIVSSLLNLQRYRIKDEESAAAIRESQLRVQAMSLMHQRLYQVEDVSMVNFRLYLVDLVETLMKAYGYDPDAFDLEIDIQKEMLEVELVMPMGLLVNEILTNSFKYAFKDTSRPRLRVSLAAAGNDLRLEVADNGPGMPEGAVRQEGFGQKLIAALCRQLKASWQVKQEGGVAYTFIIPGEIQNAA